MRIKRRAGASVAVVGALLLAASGAVPALASSGPPPAWPGSRAHVRGAGEHGKPLLRRVGIQIDNGHQRDDAVQGADADVRDRYDGCRADRRLHYRDQFRADVQRGGPAARMLGRNADRGSGGSSEWHRNVRHGRAVRG